MMIFSVVTQNLIPNNSFYEFRTFRFFMLSNQRQLEMQSYSIHQLIVIYNINVTISHSTICKYNVNVLCT